MSLGLKAIEAGYRVLFTTAAHLSATLSKAHAEGRLDDKFKVFATPRPLLIDEIGYLPIEALKAQQPATTAPAAETALNEFATRAKATWARLIRKVYEADRLVCPRCQGPMRLIALMQAYACMTDAELASALSEGDVLELCDVE